VHNTFSLLIPKLNINNIDNGGTEQLITLLEKIYEDGVSWDLKKLPYNLNN
jgi:hypothetical protein